VTPDNEKRDGCIDLHTHTTASDGTYAPEELVRAARQLGLDALAITDHETFAGYEAAVPYARQAGLHLVRGIELNTSVEVPGATRRKNLHLLAYFPAQAPSEPFLSWLTDRQAMRRDRNQNLVESLRAKGVKITLGEVEQRGRSIAGRPHFAKILVEKGYAEDMDDAFRRFIGEEAPSYVELVAPPTESAIGMVRSGGGVPVVAHPVRLSLSGSNQEREVIANLKRAGLIGLEVTHSDQSAELQHYYLQLAREFDLLPTGGSDFHGAVKPKVQLGRGVDDNVRVPESYLAGLNAAMGLSPR
jgi:predicted metal-dependent phosphoesterase TrpH